MPVYFLCESLIDLIQKRSIFHLCICFLSSNIDKWVEKVNYFYQHLGLEAKLTEANGNSFIFFSGL